ncbi:hypothetical protein QQF64_003384 [Cirrhinus molitorella]|uniref:ribonuclease H n=1 Tax=Cirrhinus molitorella TaxID=172907 RepID=A0ABR3ML64_9TELE
MEHWMEQSKMMITECECSEKEKRRRIVESLKGPALEIIKAVRMSSPDANSMQYLKALESTFGSSESGEDLYFTFRLLRQHPTESLSDFLRRIEKSLTKVVQRGGLSPSNVDKARVEQLIRGAVESAILLLQLGLRERKEHPPTFLSLLNEIREAEETEITRCKFAATAKSLHLQDEGNSCPAFVRELKAEIQELRTQLKSDRSNSLPASSMMLESRAKPRQSPAEQKEVVKDSEVQSLRKQVLQLQQQLAVMSVSSNSSSSHAQLPQPHASGQQQPKLSRNKEDYFCYQCGEDRHIATKCRINLVITTQVITKLIHSLRKAKGMRSDSNYSHQSGEQIGGHPCHALWDSGSQVTIVFDFWYSRNLPEVPIHPLAGLSIWGLSSCSYPYKGYIVIDVTFPVTLTGAEETIAILALVCPDPQGPPQFPVIIGTNASFFQRLSAYNGTTNRKNNSAHSLRIQTPPVHLVPQSGQASAADRPEGKVIWEGPGAFKVPSRRERYASCKVETKKPLRKDIFLIDASAVDPLPSGLFVSPVVMPSSAVDVTNFRVLLHNETKISQFQRGALNPELFKFGEAPIPAVWEKRLRLKLAERSNVFSTEEWDVGLVKDVTHQIRLSDPRPFRERSRHIAPADIDDVRHHLKDLLAAGIIQESRSPRTIPDQYVTPQIDEALDCLAGSRWFSVLDLRSGYYQIAMSAEDREKTTFICPLGFYQFQRMLQGITGAPATFQRLMERVVGDMHLLQVIIYLDDLIVFVRTLEEHEERLMKVLDRLEEWGLKVSIDKWQFCNDMMIRVTLGLNGRRS